MTKRLVTILVVSVLAALLLTSFAFARASWDTQRVQDERAAKIQQLSFPRADRPTENVTDRFAGLMGPNEARASRRVSVGAAGDNAATAGPGIEVEASYDDWQGSPRGRRADFWGTPDMHFVYQDQPNSTTAEERAGYNVYSPTLASWPKLLGVGCEVQAAGDFGIITSMAVTPKGRVILAGADPAAQTDNHFYYQPASGAAYSCTWGTGTKIPKLGVNGYSTWRANPGDTAPELVVPIVETQIIGTDTVLHVAARWNALLARTTGNPSNLSDFPMLYYRKLGQTAAGTWVGPKLLDTVFNQINLAASRVNSNIAVVYTRTTDGGYLHGEENDEALFYRESTDGGLNWGPRTQITSSDRSVASYSPWVEAQAVYDHNGVLHAAFNAANVDANPYTTGFSWNSLYRGSNMYHWSKSTNVVSLIYDATWDQSLLPGDLCGWIGYNALTTGYMSVSECAGKLYVFWSMANDLNNPLVVPDDCTSGGAPNDWRFYANADVYMSVSNDLAGALWDAPRNITNTYTPDCDSATGGGVCMNDVKMAVSRNGMDSSQYGVAMTWPEAPLTLGGTITNDSTLHLFYVEDHYPGQYNLQDASLTFVPTLNPLRYARLACVAPVSAPRIKISPTLLGYPMFVNHGATNVHTITVTNQGNDVLNVASIVAAKTSYATENWLTLSAPSLIVPAASFGSFNINIIATPFFTTGNVWALNGSVTLHSNVPTLDSVKVIPIVNYLVADTVVGLVWDTVATTCTRLVVSSNGDMGNLGAGGVNLDFVGLAGDCENTTANDVYLYSGGPQVIKKTGASTYVFTSALFQGDFTTDQAFKNIDGATPASGSTVDYNWFYTGKMVNRDTTIVLSRTYYAPLSGNCNFVVAETKYWPKAGSVSGVTIAEHADWDVPGIGGSDNKTGVSLKGFTYQRGTDTTLTCPDSLRYGAHALMGYFKRSEDVADSTINHDVPHGMYAQLNDSVFKYDTMSQDNEGAYYWNRDTVSGLAATGFTDDHNMVLSVLSNTTITSDTLVVYTGYFSVKQGTLTDLEANFDAAKNWYLCKLRGLTDNCVVAGCCIATVGNIDGDITDGVDVGDLTKLINNLFITFEAIDCPAEANCDGDPLNSVDVGDLTALINNLFITFAPLPACQNL